MNSLAAYDLSGRTAVITGAASGIGAETSAILASSGAAIVAADLNQDGAEATASKIRDAGGRAVGVAADVTRRADVAALVDRAVAEFGKLDIMCNIAGAMFPGLIEDLDDDVIDKGIALNLKGVLYGTQYAITAMKQTGGGSDRQRVVRRPSTSPMPGIGVYAFTKAARGDAHDDGRDRGRRARHPRQRDRAGHHRHAVHDVAAAQGRRHARHRGDASSSSSSSAACRRSTSSARPPIRRC